MFGRHGDLQILVIGEDEVLHKVYTSIGANASQKNEREGERE